MDKGCSKCNKTLSIEEFPKSSTGKYGVHSWCKNCHHDYGILNRDKKLDAVRKYRQSHRKEESNRSKKFYQEHKKEKLEYAKRYRESNKELVINRHKFWKERNPDKARKATNNWVRLNPEKSKASSANWKKNNKDKVIRLGQIRRFRLLGNGGKYSLDEWVSLCNKFNNKCLCCGSSEKLTVDHIIPLKLGGKNIIENIQPLCKSCNSKKGIKIIDYRGNFERN